MDKLEYDIDHLDFWKEVVLTLIKTGSDPIHARDYATELLKCYKDLSDLKENDDD